MRFGLKTAGLKSASLKKACLKKASFKKAAAGILASIIFACAAAQTAQAYNLAPQSFQNFYNTASAGNLQGLQSMIYRGLSLESTNQNGDTAICVAIRSQDVIAYRTLKQAGADLEPSCLKKISDEQKDAFFEQNDPEYAAQRSKSQWSKTGTAVLIGGGVAAGVIALAASGGGSGGGHSDDSTPTAPTCEDNPCGEGCFNNLTCPAGQVCSSTNTCGGCESCAVKSECASAANKCNAGCYTNLVCQAGYECAAKNECGGCESCSKKSICATDKCASGCYTDIGCGENKACTAHNTCGGCTRCDYVSNPNANHCADFDTKNNVCLKCRSGYTAVDGVCQPDKPSHCVKYDYTTKICSMCDAGYSLSSDQKSCIRDADSNCTAANFPLTTPPANANISSCYDGSTTRYKIVSCKPNYTLATDGKSCVQNSSGGDTCNATNYPLTTKPDDTSANYTFCIDGTTTRYKITSCKPNYTLASDGKSCTKGGSTGGDTDTCDESVYPFTECPNGAVCNPCHIGLSNDYRYNISYCKVGYTLSADGKSCNLACDKSTYNLSQCPNGAVCSMCEDADGTYYKFNRCLEQYVEDADGNCTINTVTDSDDFIANDKNLIITKDNVSINNNNYLIGFPGVNEKKNIFNAKTTQAEIDITITENSDTSLKNKDVYGLASDSLGYNINNLINSFNNKGVISIENAYANYNTYGISGSAGNIYNSYNGNGIITIKSNGQYFADSENSGFIVGLNANSTRIAVYNAFGGTASIDINTKAGHVYGMRGGTLINAYNGGTGYITLTGEKGSIYGMYNTSDNGFIANAYGSGSDGTITINNPNSLTAYGIMSPNPRKGTIYNAYGSNASGKIIINGSGIGIADYNGGIIYNGVNGGNGYITINSTSTEPVGQITGIYADNPLNPSYNGYLDGTGNIEITVAGSSIDSSTGNDYALTIYGIAGSVNNGSINGTGKIKITDKGNNNVTGIFGGGNFSNSSITINSNADKDKKVIGMTNIKPLSNSITEETATAEATDNVNQNYGTIDMTLTGSAKAYGIYTKNVNAANYGSIYIISENKESDKTDYYGIYGNLTGTIINTGSIDIDAYKADMTGIYVKSDNTSKQSVITNDGTITINNRMGIIGDYPNIRTTYAYGIIADNSKITNNGDIKIKQYGTGISASENSNVINEANILIEDAEKDGIGIIVENKSSVHNNGSITINASNVTGSNMTGISAYDHSKVFNNGNITLNNVNKKDLTTYGISVSAYSTIYNTGNITITGVNTDTSYGIRAIDNSKVYNSGTITINGETYNKNEADGKFIYIDSSSSMVNESEITVSSVFDTADLGGGKFILGKGGKITAEEIKGDITADAGITSGGFDKTYSSEDAFSGKTDEVKLNSGSALFDATLKDNDIVMTMKDFDEVVDDKSLAAYLQRNYDAQRNAQLFDSLKFHATAAGLNSSLNQQLGFSLLPNFAQENMNVFRSLSNLVTDTMFTQDLTNERMMVGYDYLGQDRASKGRVTGYENTANSSYFLADTKLNNRQRFGLGVALTRFNSDYDDDSSRKATFAQALGSYMHDFGNRWKYAGLLRIGYADGDYKRQSDGERVSGDTSDILYGFNNELRYNYDLGFMTLEPQFELNAYGYYQRKIKENDEKISALLVDGTNNLSIETGAGLYASKETVYGENGRVKGRLGGSYYRELSQPYHTMRARVRDTDGYYLIESTDIFDRNRVVVRADITFSWKALDFYLRGSQFLEDKHTTVINAGVKFNF